MNLRIWENVIRVKIHVSNNSLLAPVIPEHVCRMPPTNAPSSVGIKEERFWHPSSLHFEAGGIYHASSPHFCRSKIWDTAVNKTGYMWQYVWLICSGKRSCVTVWVVPEVSEKAISFTLRGLEVQDVCNCSPSNTAAVPTTHSSTIPLLKSQTPKNEYMLYGSCITYKPMWIYTLMCVAHVCRLWYIYWKVYKLAKDEA